MFTYFQSSMFQFDMVKQDDDSPTQSIIFWTTLLRKEQEDYSFKSFVDLFVHLAISALSSTTKPRVGEEIMKVMQLTEHIKTADWYLYQNYTEIRVYGNELTPY